MDWVELQLKVPAADAERAADIANMVVPYGLYIEDYSDLEEGAREIAHIDLIDEELLQKNRAEAILHLYIDPDENPAEAVAFLTERFAAAQITCTVVQNTVSETDWANNWKKYFKPLPIGERLLIQPVWEKECHPEGRQVLNIEPGMAFGTGAHETTRMCLELIERYVKDGMEMLDVGCGSGILSVAALLLGAKQAVGVDIDEMAVRTARDNAALNGVEARFTALAGNLTDRVHGQFDLVAANIVADVILMLNTSIKDYLKPGAVYLMSGIIDTREQEILDSLAQNFDILEVCRDRGWTAIAARAR